MEQHHAGYFAAGKTLAAFYTADTYVQDLCSGFAVLLFAFAGLKIKNNPQCFILSVWLCFLLCAIFWFLKEITWNLHNFKLNIALSAANETLYLIGLWTLSFQYFTSALDAQKILVDGIQPGRTSLLRSPKRKLVYWGGFTIITIQYVTAASISWVKASRGATSYGTTQNIIFLVDGFIIIILLVIALQKIKSLFKDHPEIQQSHSMMLSHMFLFVLTETIILGDTLFKIICTPG
jgi:hypothetical protein